MAQPVQPDAHSMAARAAFPLPRFISRMRREMDTKDSVNSRQFEHWQTNAPSMTEGRPDVHRRAPFYDMAPNTSRFTEQNYRSQPRYDVDGERGVQNSFFDKYDTTSDSRNMTRELKASVYEDKSTGFLKESEKLLERNFDNRWLNGTVMQQQAAAAEQLRPKRDDIRLYYRNQPSAQEKSSSTGVV